MNKIPIENNKMLEYWNEHWYSDGNGYDESGQPILENWFPSVTSILGTISKGWAYEDWLKANGYNADIIRDRAANSGSKIHNAIEQCLLGEEIHVFKDQTEYFTYEECKKFDTWFQWDKHYSPETIYVEQSLADRDLRIGGTLDYICKIEGKTYLLDWKSGNAYDTHPLQVSLYKYMAEKHLDIKIDHCGTVYLGANIKTHNKGLNAPGVKVDIVDDYEKQLEIAKKTIDLFWWKNPNSKPKSMMFPKIYKRGQ